MPAWLVESYWPTAAGSPDPAADRLGTAAESLGARLLGVVHVPGDEMTLWRLEAQDGDTVRAILEACGVPFERVVEIVDVPIPQQAPA